MTPIAPKLTFIPDILEEHFEELAFLWRQRDNALHSPAYTMREFSALEERIEAHVQGLLVIGDQVIPFLAEGLSSDDSPAAFAAAYPLLRLRSEAAASRVLEAFGSANGNRLAGLGQGLCHASVDHILPAIQALFFSSFAPITTAAAEVLAFHRALPPQRGPIEQLLREQDANLRQWGWRVVGLSALPVDPKLYSAAMRDDNTDVRRAALLAAAWSALPAAVALGRSSAQAPTAENLDALELLGILGTAEDLQRIRSIGEAKELGPRRFRVLGCFGHPALVELLLDELANPDSVTAAAAGAAFTKITGQDIDSKNRVTVPPKAGGDPDDFEAEFLEEVVLPNPELARIHWKKVRPQYAAAIRVCKGEDLSRGIDPEAFTRLDMESRCEFFLRSRFTGAWTGSPVSLEQFPQRP